MEKLIQLSLTPLKRRYIQNGMKNFSSGYAKFVMSRNYKIVRFCIIVLKDILCNKGM